MSAAVDDALAIPDKRAAKLAGITMRQLRYWDQIHLVSPSIKRRLSPRNIVRLYSFQDLLELLVAAELRHKPGISLQHIRRVVAHLHEQGFGSPLRELRFATDSRRGLCHLPTQPREATSPGTVLCARSAGKAAREGA